MSGRPPWRRAINAMPDSAPPLMARAPTFMPIEAPPVSQ